VQNLSIFSYSEESLVQLQFKFARPSVFQKIRTRIIQPMSSTHQCLFVYSTIFYSNSQTVERTISKHGLLLYHYLHDIQYKLANSEY
jgi:hypothetical protein